MPSELRPGQRVVYQRLEGRRFGRACFSDRGTLTAGNLNTLCVVWDTGEADDVTKTGECCQHPFRVRPLPTAWPDVRGPLPNEPGEQEYLDGLR